MDLWAELRQANLAVAAAGDNGSPRKRVKAYLHRAWVAKRARDDERNNSQTARTWELLMLDDIRKAEELKRLCAGASSC